MIKTSIFLILLFFSASCSSMPTGEEIEIDSIISNCIDIEKENLEKHENLLLLNTLWKMKTNIGECGCKSAALSYRVEIKENTPISSGVISSLKKKRFKFVLSSDNKLFLNDKYRIIINCKN